MPLHPGAQARRKWFCAAAGACIGLAAFFLVNTGISLDVTNDAWIRTGYAEKDILQHYTGWLFYRQSPLAFPMGVAQGINWPEGCAVTFTDSIPLFAVLFRLLSAWLPATFQYFGWFTLLCYMLQGAAAALLLSLFSGRTAAVLCGAALFVFSPVMLERSFRHTALAAHWLLLFALYLYFLDRRQGFRFRAGYLVLLGLATGIHPYFLPMLFAVFFADLLTHAAETRQVLRPLGFLLAGFAVVLAVGWAFGIFSGTASGGAAGYGYFCMNLNSLFCPVSAGGYVWSRVLAQRPQGLGSVDGFNYLGLGALLALAPCVLWRLRQHGLRGALATLRRHWALAAVCLCLTVFAVSSTVLYCNLVIVQIPLPDVVERLCSVFRASGRMFWPVYYLIFLFVFSMLARVEPRRCPWLGAVLLAALLAVQLWDISPALAQKRSFFTESRQDFDYPLQSSVWEAAAGAFTHLESLDVSLYQAVYPAYYAATAGMTTSDGWAARYDTARRQIDTREAIAALEAGRYDPDTLYITSDYETFRRLARTAGDAAWCVLADEHWYLLIPRESGVVPQADERTAIYPALPLRIADYSDDDWSFGIRNDDRRTCLFYDDETTRPYLESACALAAPDGTVYAILQKDHPVEGYVAVTLDIEDAGALAGLHLTAQ